MELTYISGDNCYDYENNFIVNAEFNYQTKENLSENFQLLHTTVNDTVVEKTKATGGNTIYFYKTNKSLFRYLLDFECNN